MANAYIDRTTTWRPTSASVQGVSQWLIEQDVNSGGWETVDVSDAPGGQGDANGYYLVQPTDAENPVWVFAYQHLFDSILYSVGDTVQFRATPAGYDEGMGDPVLSDVYDVLEPRTAQGGGSMTLSMAMTM